MRNLSIALGIAGIVLTSLALPKAEAVTQEPSTPSEPTSSVAEAEDTQAPVLESSSVTPSRVSKSGGTVQVDLHITDDLSGVSASSPSARFTNYYDSILLYPDAFTRVSGDERDGIYRATATFPPGTAPGEWTLLVGAIRDNAGNVGQKRQQGGVRVGAAAAPTNVTATVDENRQVTVTWDPPTDDGGYPISEYLVYVPALAKSYDASDTSFTTSAATWPTDTPITFTVSAANAGGHSDPSEPSEPLILSTADENASDDTDGDGSSGTDENASDSKGSEGNSTDDNASNEGTVDDATDGDVPGDVATEEVAGPADTGGGLADTGAGGLVGAALIGLVTAGGGFGLMQTARRRKAAAEAGRSH